MGHRQPSIELSTNQGPTMVVSLPLVFAVKLRQEKPVCTPNVGPTSGLLWSSS
jgi:hypothetical protein